MLSGKDAYRMKLRRDNSAVRYSISFEELPVCPMDVLSVVGYKPDRVPPFVHELMREIFAEAASKCSIEGGYRIYDSIHVSDTRQHIRIDQLVFSTHKIITVQLNNARQVAVFACTAGSALEDWSKALIKGEEQTKGYLIDTLASVVVEAAMDIIHDHLEAESAKRALRVSNRYSPGYCHWPLTDIHQLMKMLPPDFCNISLNDAAFMTPAKSICGIIGVGPKVKRSDYKCDCCDIEDCVHRGKLVPER